MPIQIKSLFSMKLCSRDNYKNDTYERILTFKLKNATFKPKLKKYFRVRLEKYI